MTKITIFDQQQLARYKGKKGKLLIADNAPMGFIGEQVEIVKANNNEGCVLFNPNLCINTVSKRADQILKELEQERLRVLQWKKETTKSSAFNRFSPEFPFLIDI